MTRTALQEERRGKCTDVPAGVKAKATTFHTDTHKEIQRHTHTGAQLKKLLDGGSGHV